MILTDDEVWSLWNSQGTDDMNMQEAATFARAIESAVLRKLRERPADAWVAGAAVDWLRSRPNGSPAIIHTGLTKAATVSNGVPLHIIPTEANE